MDEIAGVKVVSSEGLPFSDKEGVNIHALVTPISIVMSKALYDSIYNNGPFLEGEIGFLHFEMASDFEMHPAISEWIRDTNKT